MDKLPTDLLFLFLAFCPPPDYVNLAVALCRRLSLYPLRRKAMAQTKGDEWRKILLEQRIQRWREFLHDVGEKERGPGSTLTERTNQIWNAIYSPPMIDIFAKLLAERHLCPLKDGLPNGSQLQEIIRSSPTTMEAIRRTMMETLK